MFIAALPCPYINTKVMSAVQLGGVIPSLGRRTLISCDQVSVLKVSMSPWLPWMGFYSAVNLIPHSHPDYLGMLDQSGLPKLRITPPSAV